MVILNSNTAGIYFTCPAQLACQRWWVFLFCFVQFFCSRIDNWNVTKNANCVWNNKITSRRPQPQLLSRRKYMESCISFKRFVLIASNISNFTKWEEKNHINITIWFVSTLLCANGWVRWRVWHICDIFVGCWHAYNTNSFEMCTAKTW